MSFASVDNSAGLLHNGGQMAWDAVSPGHIVMATITADYKLLVQEINFSGGNTVIGKASFVKQLSGWTGAAHVVHFRPRIFSLGDGKILVLAPASFQYNLGITASSTYVTYLTGTNATLSGSQSLGANCIAPFRYSFISMARDVDGNYKITGSIDLDTAEEGTSTGQGVCSTYFPLELYTKNANVLEFRRNYIPFTSGSVQSYFKKITINIADGAVTGGLASTTYGAQSISSSYALYDVRTKLDRNGNPVKIYTVGTRGQSDYLGSSSTLYISTDWYTTGYAESVVASRGGNKGTAPMGSYIGPSCYAPMEPTGVDCFVIGGTVAGANQSVNNNLSSAGQLIYHALDAAWVTESVVCIVTPPTSSAYFNTLDADITVAIRQSSYGVNIPISLSFREIAGAGTYVGPVDAIPTPYYAEQFKNVGNMIHRIDDTHFWLVGCFRDSAQADSKLGVITVSI